MKSWIPGWTIMGLLAAGLVACSEPPPRTVLEYMEDPVLMEATLARCRQEGAVSSDDVSCSNARRAAARLAAQADAERRARLEAESERAREARRRQEEAAEAARRQAEEAARRREQEDYDASWVPAEPPDAAVPTESRGDGPLPAPAVDDAPPQRAVPQESGRTPVDEAQPRSDEASRGQ